MERTSRPQILIVDDQRQNLIGNAVKFHGDRPPHVRVTAEPADSGGWIFEISDNGIGIDEAYFERIFGVFQRLHARDEYPGTGIGLSTCKKIVELYGGEISLRSKLGEGTTFRFALKELSPNEGQDPAAMNQSTARQESLSR